MADGLDALLGRLSHQFGLPDEDEAVVAPSRQHHDPKEGGGGGGGTSGGAGGSGSSGGGGGGSSFNVSSSSTTSSFNRSSASTVLNEVGPFGGGGKPACQSGFGKSSVDHSSPSQQQQLQQLQQQAPTQTGMPQQRFRASTSSINNFATSQGHQHYSASQGGPSDLLDEELRAAREDLEAMELQRLMQAHDASRGLAQSAVRSAVRHALASRYARVFEQWRRAAAAVAADERAAEPPA